ncbi:hypothetical protein IWX90DRAFT_384245 [Phyllosticta citrichinensis]|uniref:Guanine nucleotide-exchange factor SEC12 n=1 Tax=Phyllosticta citrichinensis TaxID=1130410 RepID=A0ABR1XY21_9PEZI
MAPPISFTKATLSYPVFAADFDPYNRGYLVVAGGGGENRSGVPNKITLLDASSRSTLDVVSEIDLPRDEDAVMSLANLASKGGLVTLAGINSSEKSRLGDNNQHLRAFAIDYPKRTKNAEDSEDKAQGQEEGTISPAGKTKLFKNPTAEASKKENYQRILRLSPAQKREAASKRIGAIATGLNPESELVIFDATTATPTNAEVIQRIYPKEGKEINDIDIAEESEGEFSVTYCTDYQVFVRRFGYDFAKKKSDLKSKSEGEMIAYTLPFNDVFTPGPRPIIKYLRFLTPHHILLCANLPQRKGAELLVLRKEPFRPGEIILRKKLPKRIKAASGLDVCALDVDRNTGARQIVVAVAGHDISIEVYTLDYSGDKTDSISKFSSFTTLRDVHPIQMTKLAFSKFHSPWPISSSETPKSPGPQYLRLASTSLGNTVVVDTFSLSPVQPRKPYSRYVLTRPRRAVSAVIDTGFPVLVIGFALLVTLLLFQSYIDIRSNANGYPNTIQLVPESLRSALARMNVPLPPGARVPQINVSPTEASASLASVGIEATEKAKASVFRLKDILQQYSIYPSSDSNTDAKAIIIRQDSSSSPDEEEPRFETAVFDSTADAQRADPEAKQWDDLSEEQQQKWKQRLLAAGAWTVEEGETILKVVMWREVAKFVGGVVNEAL